MKFEDKTEALISACLEVYSCLGNGFVESVYQEALIKELSIRRIPYGVEKEIRVKYKEFELNKSFRVDLICYNCIILELKAVDTITPIHVSQLINYLKVSRYPVGLVVNFGSTSLQFKRRDLSSFEKNPINPKILNSL